MIAHELSQNDCLGLLIYRCGGQPGASGQGKYMDMFAILRVFVFICLYVCMCVCVCASCRCVCVCMCVCVRSLATSSLLPRLASSRYLLVNIPHRRTNSRTETDMLLQCILAFIHSCPSYIGWLCCLCSGVGLAPRLQA